MIAGGAIKSLAILVHRFFDPPGLLAALTTYDPLGVRIADAVLPLFFDTRGIAPPAIAIHAFEVLLVFGFAAQCFGVGVLIVEVRRLIRSRSDSIAATN